MPPKSLTKRIKGKKQISQIAEICVVLGATAVLFCVLGTNMLVFGLFVYAGLIWMIASTPNRRISLVTGIVSGLIGALTEYWGCSSHLWNWVTPCKSIWMVNGQESGFPVEVAIAYFAAGFWISKVSLNLFGPEHEKTREFFVNKEYKSTLALRIIAALAIDIAGIVIILIEPTFIQSVGLFMAGSNIFIFLSTPAMKAVAGFALLMGCAGFFFENFATGFFESFAVWKYNPALHVNLGIPNPMIGVAPVSAFIAYTGSGMILFGLSFLLNIKK